mmetsp:Transcript_12747/g.19644  ORF Transcript_12747/g.19644 Transcript_12747/m.19644 type:complete len:132 (-) Transcript_12747:634-1029(-)
MQCFVLLLLHRQNLIVFTYDEKTFLDNNIRTVHYRRCRCVEDRCISAAAPAAIAANFAACPHDIPDPRLLFVVANVVVLEVVEDAPPNAASATFCAVFLASLNIRSLVTGSGTDSPLAIAASRSSLSNTRC